MASLPLFRFPLKTSWKQDPSASRKALFNSTAFSSSNNANHPFAEPDFTFLTFYLAERQRWAL